MVGCLLQSHRMLLISNCSLPVSLLVCTHAAQAHGSLSMIQDRLKGKKMQAGDITPDVMLGRQTLLNCAAFKGYGHGCYGGDTIDVFKYMAEEGLPDESCMHYQATVGSSSSSSSICLCKEQTEHATCACVSGLGRQGGSG